MNEELKEQIHERVYNLIVPTLGFSKRDLFNIAMEYAEPREKRIAELEKENAELKRIVKMVAMINKDIYTEEGIKAIYAEAEQFLNSEVEK